MHYDHAGMLHRYPGARFHLKASEMAYATGRCICGGPRRRGYELEDVVYPVRCVNADRVTFRDQTAEITSGLSVHRIGCHTAGQQVAKVWTRSGWVAIASDASRLSSNMTTGILFPSVYRNDKMVEGYLTLYQLSEGSWDHVVPGHDSLVMALYPAPGKELAGIVVRLDVPPRPLS